MNTNASGGGVKSTAIKFIGSAILVLFTISIIIHGRISRDETAREFESKSVLLKIEVACKEYKADFGSYPPDKIKLGSLNLKSSHALAYFLCTPFNIQLPANKQNRAPYIRLPNPNVIYDYNCRGYMFVDSWGNPIEYDNLVDDPDGFDSLGSKDVRDGIGRNLGGFDLFTSGGKKIISNW